MGTPAAQAVPPYYIKRNHCILGERVARMPVDRQTQCLLSSTHAHGGDATASHDKTSSEFSVHIYHCRESEIFSDLSMNTLEMAEDGAIAGILGVLKAGESFWLF